MPADSTARRKTSKTTPSSVREGRGRHCIGKAAVQYIGRAFAYTFPDSESLAEAVDGLAKSDLDGGYDKMNIEDQLTDLRLLTSYLENELNAVRQENADFRRDVMTSSLRSQPQLTADDVGRLVYKMAELMNGTMARHSPLRPDVGGSELPRDCQDVYDRGYHVSAVYEIQPDGAGHPDGVYCQIVNGTAWTVIQRRVDGSVNFDRGWNDYRYGFGGAYGEHWIGTDMLHWLTSQRNCRLRVDLWDWDGGRSFAEYDMFLVDGHADNYRLHVRGYHGNAGDSLSYHDDMAFSTIDMDNDLHMSNCAEENRGGWWFNSCSSSNLNGIYQLTGWYARRPVTWTSAADVDSTSADIENPEAVGDSLFGDGIFWFTLKETEFYSLKRVEMKLRPSD